MRLEYLIYSIFYKCLVCCFLLRRTSSSAALMAGLGAHWARQTSLARLFHSQMRNITRVDNKIHSLHTLDKHNALCDSSKSLSRPLVGRRRPRNWGRDFRNHGEDVLFAAGGFTESSTYGPARQTFLPDTHLRSRRPRRISRYRF